MAVTIVSLYLLAVGIILTLMCIIVAKRSGADKEDNTEEM